jgi:hypothetical protein
MGFGRFLNLSVLGKENFCLEEELLSECCEESRSAMIRGVFVLNKIISK